MKLSRRTTELNDRNGTEIFEGDRVKNLNNCRPELEGTVEFRRGGFYVVRDNGRPDIFLYNTADDCLVLNVTKERE
jgi:hypothetical protein